MTIIYPPGTSGGGGGGSGTVTTVKDEGVNVDSAVVSINFTGAQQATAIGHAVTVNVPGGVTNILANRPAASDANRGEVFYATDVGKFYISDGSTWTTIGTLAGLLDTTISAPANAQLFQYQSGDGKWHNVTVSGDATLASGGALTVVGHAITNKIGALTMLGHSYLGGTTQQDTGTSNVFQEGVAAKLQSMLHIHEENTTNLAFAASNLTSAVQPLNGIPFTGWGAAFGLMLPNNNININAALDTVISDPVVAVNGGFFLCHGVNDFSSSLPSAVVSVYAAILNNAWQNALRAVLSRARAGTVYGSSISSGAITWDSSIAFSGGSNVASVGQNTGPAYRTIGTSFTITLPSNFTGGIAAINLIGQGQGYTTLNGGISSGQTALLTNSNDKFPQSGTVVVKIDSEEILVTAGLGSNNWTVIVRGVNGTSAAAHSNGAIITIAQDTCKIDWSGTVSSATGSTFTSGQGANTGIANATTPGPVTKRFVCLASDAGKTIIGTFNNLVAGDTSAFARFDSWQLETADPPPAVVMNLQHFEFGETADTGVARIAAFNTATDNVVAEFDSFVKVADVYTPWYNRNGVIGTNMNNTDVTTTGVTWTANSSTFTPVVGQEFTFGRLGGERVRVAAVSGSAPNWTLDLTRGVGGTAKASHSNGDWMGPGDWMHTDLIHLNVRGHAVFAQAAYSAFDSMPAPSTYQIAETQGNWSQYTQLPSMGIVDNFYLYPPVNVLGTTAIASNKMTAHPIYIPKVCVVTEIGAAITAVNASPSTLRFGIYLPNGSHSQPGILLQELGTVVASVTANAAVVGCYQVLRPGWYWLAYVSQGGGATSTVRTISTLGMSFPAIMSDAALGAAGITGVSVTGISGALPNIFTATSMDSGGTARVHLRLRSPHFG